MTDGELPPLARDYLVRLRRAGAHLDAERRDELLLEVEGYLVDALAPEASPDEVVAVLERLGPPGDVVEAERPRPPAPADRRGTREWAAVILLPLGGFAFGIGWIVGLILLWSSRLWTVRDKVIGTLIVPGGLATGVLLLLVAGTSDVTSECSGQAEVVDPTTGAVTSPASMHCTTIGAPSTATTILHVALAVLLLLGPIIVAIYLARRARRGPAAIAVI